jgi:hypothetical protein
VNPLHQSTTTDDSNQSKMAAIVLSPFASRDRNENINWKEFKDNALPCFVDFLGCVRNDLTIVIAQYFNGKYPYARAAIVHILTYHTLCIGHLISPVGRQVWSLILTKCVRYLKMIFGYWDDDTFACYNFHTKIDKQTRDKLDADDEAEQMKKFARELSAIVSTRALMLQFIPILTPLSMYAVMTSNCPPLVKSASIKEQLSPLLPHAGNALQIIAAKEMKRFGSYEALKESKINWMLNLKSYKICIEHSRAFQYFLNLFQFASSLGFMYGDPNFWVIMTIAVLLPYSIILCLDVVVFVGKKIGLTDDDLRIIGIDFRFGHLRVILNEKIDIENKIEKEAREKREDRGEVSSTCVPSSIMSSAPSTTPLSLPSSIPSTALSSPPRDGHLSIETEGESND